MDDAQKERDAIVAWLWGSHGKIPALSAFASLVSGNRMPSMSGDDRDRLHAHHRQRFDEVMNSICSAIERGDHLLTPPERAAHEGEQEQINDRT